MKTEVPQDLRETIATVLAESITDDLDRGRGCVSFGEAELDEQYGSTTFTATKRYDERFLDGETDEPVSGDHSYGNAITETVFSFLLNRAGDTLYVRQLEDGRETYAAGTYQRDGWGEWTSTDKGLTYKRSAR